MLCLNRDGRVHASFDQGGYAEFYEYEEGGSKVTVRDGNGNILSESRTHSCSTNSSGRSGGYSGYSLVYL